MCIDGDLAAAAEMGMPSECAGAIQSFAVARTGTVTFTAEDKTGGGTDTLTIGLLVDATCGTALKGETVTISTASCAEFQTYLGTNEGTTSASCAVGGYLRLH